MLPIGKEPLITERMGIRLRSMLGFVAGAVSDVFAPKPPPSKTTSDERPERRAEPRRCSTEGATIKWRKPAGELAKQEIEIKDRSSGGLGIQFPDEIPVGQTVTISAPEDKKYRGVLRHCRSRGGGYFAGAVLVFRERRRHDREPVAGEGTLSWSGPAGAPIEEQVGVQNLSEEGIQLVVPSKVPVASMVRLTGSRAAYFGSSCYCQSESGKYLVGLHVVRHAGESRLRDVVGEMYLGGDDVSGHRRHP